MSEVADIFDDRPDEAVVTASLGELRRMWRQTVIASSAEFRVPCVLGTFVAEPYHGEYYDGMRIILERPDGTSGQVALTEAISSELAAREAGFATQVHTFCCDGNDPDFASYFDCDHEGACMRESAAPHEDLRAQEASGRGRDR